MDHSNEDAESERPRQQARLRNNCVDNETTRREDNDDVEDMTADAEIPIVLSNGCITFDAQERKSAVQNIDGITRNLNENSPDDIKILLVASVIIIFESIWASGKKKTQQRAFGVVALLLSRREARMTMMWRI